MAKINNKKSINRGITLLEVILSVAVISIISALSIPVFQSFQVKNELSLAASTITQSLRRAQVLSQAVKGDSSWGVHVSANSATLYKGASYASRDVDYDESYSFSSEINLTGLQDVIYSRFDGLPSATGNITLTTNAGEQEIININEKGMLEY